MILILLKLNELSLTLNERFLNFQNSMLEHLDNDLFLDAATDLKNDYIKLLKIHRESLREIQGVDNGEEKSKKS